MELNRNTVCLLFLCAALLGGCATSTPRSGEMPSAGAANFNESDPGISKRNQRDYERALAAIKAKRHKQAERILLEITQTNTDLSGPYANLGIVYYRTGRIEEAEKALRKAIALNPERADTYNHLGVVLRTNGKFQEARAAYEKALELKPGYSYAHLNLAILYDLYLLDASRALAHYDHYQQALTLEDKRVAKWVVDLKRRAKRAQKMAMR